MSDRVGPRKVRTLPPVELDEWGDGPLGMARAFAVRLRRQGASEALAAQQAANVFAADAEQVCRTLGWHGGLSTLTRGRGR